MNHWDTYFSEGKSFQPLNEIFLDLLLHELELKIGRKPESAIDLGCGDGDTVVKLARRGLETLGIDGSRVGLELATNAISESKLHNAQVLLADLETLKLPNASDVVLCRLTFAFIKAKEQFLSTVKSSLTKNGAFVLITPVTFPKIKYLKTDKPGIAVDFEETKKLLSQHFTNVDAWHHNYFAEHGDTVTFITK